jgi:hypothetical protein
VTILTGENVAYYFSFMLVAKAYQENELWELKTSLKTLRIGTE